MNKRLFSGITSIALIISLSIPASASDIQTAGATGTVTVPATVTATTMSVTVPTQLPITIDSEGTATYATNASIKNNSFGPIVVKDASITGQNGWEIVSYDTDMSKQPAGTKKLSFSLNECETDGKSASIPGVYSAIGIINGGGTEENLNYTGNIPAQTTAIDATTAAKVVFTVDWYKGVDGSIDNNDESGNPVTTYLVGESYPVSFTFDGVPEGQDTVVWESTDENIATVQGVENMSLIVSGTKSAVVTVVGTGSCEIKATLGNGYTKSLPITTSEKLTGLAISADRKNQTDTLATVSGGTEYLTIIKTPENGILIGNVVWESSDPSIVSIRKDTNTECYIDANAVGTATITAKCGDLVSNRLVVTVKSYNSNMKNWEEGSTSDFHNPTYLQAIERVDICSGASQAEPSIFDLSWDISEEQDNSVTAFLSDNNTVLTIFVERGLANIGDNFVRGASNIQNVYFKMGIETSNISPTAFIETGIRNFMVEDAWGTEISSVDGVLFTDNRTKLIAYPSGRTDSMYYIPDNVTSIAPYAFYKLESMQSIYMGNNVKTIGDYAFYGRFEDLGNQGGIYPQGIREITLSNTLETIGSHAFENTQLRDISLPSTLKTISEGAFKNCSLTAINIPSSVTSIGNDTFTGSRLSASEITYTGTAIGFPWGAAQ